MKHKPLRSLRKPYERRRTKAQVAREYNRIRSLTASVPVSTDSIPYRIGTNPHWLNNLLDN